MARKRSATSWTKSLQICVGHYVSDIYAFQTLHICSFWISIHSQWEELVAGPHWEAKYLLPPGRGMGGGSWVQTGAYWAYKICL